MLLATPSLTNYFNCKATPGNPISNSTRFSPQFHTLLQFRGFMESQGQKTSNNPKAMLTSLMSKRQKLQEELRTIEKQVYELETSYLQESSNFGNVWRGYEGFLSSSKNTANLKRSKKFQHEDRLFSLSSVTSPATEELNAGREEGRSDLGPGRPKGGGLTINGQGKPKKGRAGPRDGRKIRLSNDMDLDDDEDHDMGGMR